MMGHCRAPAVQYRRDADAGSEVLRVGRDGEHRLRRGLEQQIVDHSLVLVGDVANRRRQRENDVEIGNREQFVLARRHPLACRRALALRAVPVAAAVVGDRGMGAVLAARDVSAEGRCAAVLDGAHHLELEQARVTAVGMTPRGPVVAEDVRDLQSWTGHVGRYAGGSSFFFGTSGVSLSSGLMTSRMMLAATWV